MEGVSVSLENISETGLGAMLGFLTSGGFIAAMIVALVVCISLAVFMGRGGRGGWSWFLRILSGIIGVGVVLSILQALGIPALAIIINAFNWLLDNLTVPVV